jgi:hypothetical protein
MSTINPEPHDQPSETGATPTDTSQFPTTSSPVPPAATMPAGAPPGQTSAGIYQPGYGFPLPPGGGVDPSAGYGAMFAPVARQPRAPWIAPNRKAAVMAIALVAAVVLLGLGFLGGSLISGHGNHHRPSAFAHSSGRSGHGQFHGPQQRGPNTRTFPSRPSGSATSTPTPSSTS